MNHPAWRVLDAAINELDAIGDLQLQTARRYVIGFLIKELARAGLLGWAPVNGAKSTLKEPRTKRYSAQ
jgi:hypothetical protein